MAEAELRSIAGICFEVYVTARDVAPEQMRTELYVPIV